MNLKLATELVVGNIYYLNTKSYGIICMQLVRIDNVLIGKEYLFNHFSGNFGRILALRDSRYIIHEIQTHYLYEEYIDIPPIKPPSDIPSDGYNSPPAEYTPLAY